MQIPSTLIIQHVRPSYWLGFMEIGWGAFTFAQAGMSSYNQLYAFRFLVGFFESSWFPCMLFVMGSWYTKTELGASSPDVEVWDTLLTWRISKENCVVPHGFACRQCREWISCT